MWHNGYMATPGSVRGHETRPDGLAKNPDTNYQAFFRYGSHQSLTRSWLKPTHQTQSLITRKSWTTRSRRGSTWTSIARSARPGKRRAAC